MRFPFALLLLAFSACTGGADRQATAERVAQDTAKRTWQHEVGVDSVQRQADTTTVWVSPRNWMATDAPQASVRVGPTGRIISIRWILGG